MRGLAALGFSPSPLHPASVPLATDEPAQGSVDAEWVDAPMSDILGFALQVPKGHTPTFFSPGVPRPYSSLLATMQPQTATLEAGGQAFFQEMEQ